MKTRSPNCKYYRTKADALFMAQFREQKCEVCGSIIGCCGHHIVAKSRSKALRYEKKNIIVVCPRHHTMGNTMAPHSVNSLAVERFLIWFRKAHPERHAWIVANERIERRYTFKQACENMENGREAWNNGC